MSKKIIVYSVSSSISFSNIMTLILTKINLLILLIIHINPLTILIVSALKSPLQTIAGEILIPLLTTKINSEPILITLLNPLDILFYHVHYFRSCKEVLLVY